MTQEEPERTGLAETGGTVWLTGLSGSGKSTLAGALKRRLDELRREAYVLDGDQLRAGLSADLGFDAASRSEHARRVAHVAQLFADAGAVAIVSLISPYGSDRDRARSIHTQAGLGFVEVFVNTPLEECERRDTRNLYARARRGEIADFTGVSAPYEAPEEADVEVRPAVQSVTESVEHVVVALFRAGLLESAPRRSGIR